MKNFKIVIFVLFISCNQNKTETVKSALSGNTNDSLTSALMGKWGTFDGEPIWEIKKDSLYYFSEKKSYYYLIHNKDIIVLYKEGPFMLSNIHFSKDTLFFKITHGGIVEMLRIKNS